MLLLSLFMHFRILDLLSLHIVSLLYPTFGGVTFMVSVDFIAFFTLCFAGRCPVISVAWVWQPRDCIREAYKRIGHAEISNF